MQQDNVWRIDELLYKLVENNVAYAGEQFGENLRFNGETLTNVLYDNIKKLLGDKFEEDDFANWLADELLKNGYIVKSVEQEKPKEQPKEEIVYAIDEKDYQELLDKIHATIVLLQTNKSTIEKRLSELDGQVQELGNSIDTQTELKVRRDKEIQNLVDRIQSNQENIETYIESHEKVKLEFAEKVLGLNKKVDGFAQVQGERQIQDGKLAIKTKDILDRAGRNWQRAREEQEKLQDKLGQLGKRQEQPKKASANAAPPAKPAKKPSGKLGKSMLPGVGGKKKLGRNIFGKKITPKKPSVVSRIKGKIGSGASKLKKKISNSAIGKTYRAVAKVVKFIVKMVKGVAKAVVKTVKAAWKVTKFVAKTFYKASKFTGKVIKAAGNAAISGAKKLGKIAMKGPKALAAAVLSINPGKLVTKLGWKAIKFVGKSIWKGIKKLAFKALSFFGKLFGIMGKFVNKIGHWIGILAHGIADKAYRFIVRPIASMMVSIFNFVAAAVLSPISFIKWLIPTVMDKVMGTLSNISQAVKGVLKSTWGIFKRILRNPITIALLIGGLFFLLWKWLGPKLSSGIEGIKDAILPVLKSIATWGLNFLTGIWNMLLFVGEKLFKAIDWITNPKGILARFFVGAVKLFLAFKAGLKKLMKATGRNDIDILCMFLAGDMIGLAIHAIAGALKTFWDWLKTTTFFKLVIGLVKTIVAIGKLIGNIGTALWESIKSVVKNVFTFNFSKICEDFCRPWKGIWQQVKDIFTGKFFSDELAKENEALQVRPSEEAAEKAKNTKIAIRSLKMVGKGKGLDNIAYLNKLQGENAKGDLLPRIEKMGEIYEQNAE